MKNMKKETKRLRNRFLVATLNQSGSRKITVAGGGGGGGGPRYRIPKKGGSSSSPLAAQASDAASADESSAVDYPEVSHELINKRSTFLELCTVRNWQFDELHRAHFSTMMILASLGGEPNNQDLPFHLGGPPSKEETSPEPMSG